MLPVEEAKSVGEDDIFESDSCEATSTSKLALAEIYTTIESFSIQLCQLQFDKAREFIEGQKTINDNNPIIGRVWPVLASCLSQLTTQESVYFSLAFFTSKFSFRKENHLKVSYGQLKTELVRSLDSLESELVADENLSILKQILKNFVNYLDVRTELINFYTSLQNKSYENVAEECLVTLESITVPPSENLSFASLVQKEINVLISAFKSQQFMSLCSMLDSLLALKNLRELLDEWFKELESNTPSSKPLPTSIFRFGKTSKPTNKHPLLTWLSSFYQTLVAKFSLYFNDVLKDFGPSVDSKIIMANGSINFLQTFYAFAKKNTPALICIIVNRIDQEEAFYGFGYHKHLERFSSEYCKPATGIIEKYPVLYFSSSDKKLFESLQPSITSFVQDAYLRDGLDGKVKYVYDKNKEQSFFCAHVEKNLHLVVAFNRRVQEREPALVTFYNDVLTGLRFTKLFQELRMVKN